MEERAKVIKIDNPGSDYSRKIYLEHLAHIVPNLLSGKRFIVFIDTGEGITCNAGLGKDTTDFVSALRSVANRLEETSASYKSEE
jgi:hypothetical protein